MKDDIEYLSYSGGAATVEWLAEHFPNVPAAARTAALDHSIIARGR